MAGNFELLVKTPNYDMDLCLDLGCSMTSRHYDTHGRHVRPALLYAQRVICSTTYCSGVCTKRLVLTNGLIRLLGVDLMRYCLVGAVQRIARRILALKLSTSYVC